MNLVALEQLRQIVLILSDDASEGDGEIVAQRQVRFPAPAAAASDWQCRSAPSRPPRLAPLPGPELVTKNDISLPSAAVTVAPHRNGEAARTASIFVPLRIVGSFLLSERKIRGSEMRSVLGLGHVQPLLKPRRGVGTDPPRYIRSRSAYPVISW